MVQEIRTGISFYADYINENLTFRQIPEAIFTDVNDTIIKTEYMTPFDIAWEASRMPHFKDLIGKLGYGVYGYRGSNLDITLVTGNSFDYVRGRLEPYRLREIPKINWIISSENGLIAQDISQGITMWIAESMDEYKKAIIEIRNFADRNYVGTFYYQGNQIKTTFKPSKIENFDRNLVPEVMKFAESRGFQEYIANGKNHLNKDRVGTMYYHPGEALDLDPHKVVIDGELSDFEGKSYTVRRIIKERNIKYGWAFGDSKSDIPMFEEALEHGFDCFLVGNNTIPEDSPIRRKLQVIPRHMVGAINVAVASALSRLGLYDTFSVTSSFDLEEMKRKGILRVSNDMYNVYDLTKAESISLTELLPGNSTRGHVQDTYETYKFISGAGELELRFPEDLTKEIDLKDLISQKSVDNRITAIYSVKSGSCHKVDKGIFHMVHNKSNIPLIFISEYPPQIKRTYSD